MKVSVILPTYNERDNIEELIETIQEVASPYEIIVVDDDSPDGTWRVVEKLQKEHENLKLLRRIDRRGLTTAIWEGVSMARGDAVVWLDCDLSMPPQVIPKLVAALDEADVVVGSRYIEGGRDQREFTRVLTSRLFNAFASLLLGGGIKDYTSGFLAVRRNVVEKMGLRGDYGEYCVDFLYRASKKFKITEVPYVFVSRKAGETKTAPSFWNLLKHGLNYGKLVLKLRIKGWV
jgi:dolichol-phosphate mannosyltransferase